MNTIHGLPIIAPPMDFPRPMPDGDTCENYVLQLVPGSEPGFEGVPVAVAFKPVHILQGPSTLGRNLPLPGRTPTPLWDLASLPAGPEFDQWGMRGGLAAYVPPGVYEAYGKLVVACPMGTEVNVIVRQGHNLSQNPARAGIVSENPEQVGFGVGVTSGGDYRPFTIYFSASSIQFAGAAGQANEISVWAYAKSAETGAALGVIETDEFGGGGGPAHMVSELVIKRTR
jgi:hypothetical protein